MDELIKADALCREIYAATDLRTVKDLRDKAIALVNFYKTQHDEAARTAMARARVTAEVKIGELTRQLPKSAADRKSAAAKSKFCDRNLISKKAALAEIGLSTKQAWECETLAEIGQNEIDRIMAAGAHTMNGILKAAGKIKAEPKQRPSKQVPEEIEAAINRGLDDGKSREEIADELGISMTPVRRVARERWAVEAERARQEQAEPVFTRDDLAPSQQEKFDSVVARYQKRLDATFEQRVAEEVRQRTDEVIAEIWTPQHQKLVDHAKRVEAAYKGVMSRQTYRKILSCLHPDSRANVSEGVLSALFIAFGKLEDVLVKPDDPLMAEMLRTMEPLSELIRKRQERATKGRR